MGITLTGKFTTLDKIVVKSSSVYVPPPNLPPVWQTEAGHVATAARDERFTISLFATDPEGGPVTYRFEERSELAESVKLSRTGMLTGWMSYAPQEAPAWTTPEYLGRFNEQSAISLKIAATPLPDRTITTYGIVDGFLPWGIAMTGTTGDITGMVDQEGGEEPVFPNPPSWTTPEGSLGTFNEGATVDLPLTASPQGTATTISKIFIHAGYLPWGLSFDHVAFKLTGTVGEISPSLEGEVPVTPKPVWVTAADLGSRAEATAVTISLTATPAPGQTISTYSLVQDGPPWGLTLVSATGVLSGTLDTVTANTTTTFTVRALQSDGAYEDQTFTLTVTNT